MAEMLTFPQRVTGMEGTGGDPVPHDRRFTVEDIARRWTLDHSAEYHNRVQSAQDHRFLTNQWEAANISTRTQARRPIQTHNMILPLVGQMVGRLRKNPIRIGVIPTSRETAREAEVRQGIIRHIENMSRADQALVCAHQNQVIGGEGCFTVEVVPHKGRMELRLMPIVDPLGVMWDRNSQNVTGKDAAHVFVLGHIDESAVRERWPSFSASEMSRGRFFDGSESWQATYIGAYQAWYDQMYDNIRQGALPAVTFWRMVKRPSWVFGRDADYPVYVCVEKTKAEQVIEANPLLPYTVVDRTMAEGHVVIGDRIVKGPTLLPTDRLPVFRCVGWVSETTKTRTRFGMVRFLRGPQNLYNYGRSAQAEAIASQPSGKWLANSESIREYQSQYRNAARSGDPVLLYDGVVKPEFISPEAPATGFGVLAQTFEQEMHRIAGLNEATLGRASNEVSGRAILERRAGDDIGTAIYEDNLITALMEAGRTINDLIPFVYSDHSILRMMDERGALSEVSGREINLWSSDFEVQVAPRSPFATRREEGHQALMNLLQTSPEMFSVVGDKVIEFSDMPDAQIIARRVRRNMPSHLIDIDEFPAADREAEQNRRQEMAEAEQARQARENNLFEIEKRTKEAQAKVAEAQAMEAQAKAMLAEAQAKKVYDEMGIKEAEVAVKEYDAQTRRMNIG